jgi:O-antigen/teichoic acid export membrane protein
MATEKIQELDARELRKFGITTGALIAALFGVLLPWAWDFRFPTWPWVIFIVLSLWALINPRSLRPVYRGWMRFGLLISKITTPIVLGIVFYVVFVPVGIVFRLLRYDPMKRDFDSTSETYRISKSNQSESTLENPY